MRASSNAVKSSESYERSELDVTPKQKTLHLDVCVRPSFQKEFDHLDVASITSEMQCGVTLRRMSLVHGDLTTVSHVFVFRV